MKTKLIYVLLLIFITFISEKVYAKILNFPDEYFSIKDAINAAEYGDSVFVKGLFEKKGVNKNLWAKKFIKNIDYSKEEIVVILYYKSSSEEAKDLYPASGRVGAAAGRSSVSLADKKITPISTDRGNYQDWLPIWNLNELSL